MERIISIWPIGASWVLVAIDSDNSMLCDGTK